MAGVIDSRNVRPSENTSLSGVHAGKKIAGGKRHIIDTCGKLIACEVDTATIADRDGAPGALSGSAPKL